MRMSDDLEQIQKRASKIMLPSLPHTESLVHLDLTTSKRGEKNYAVAFIHLYYDQQTESAKFYHLLITKSTLLDALDLFQCPNAALSGIRKVSYLTLLRNGMHHLN